MKSNAPTFRKTAVATAVASMVAFGPSVTVVYAADAVAPAEEEMIVTGSRIPRANLTAPTAVTTIDSEIISRSGLNNVADLLRAVPSFGVSALSTNNSNFLTSGAGVNTLELRNLEEDRTLVLVNGRRYVSGLVGSSSVDFNTIPTQLIDRIEVITGGASAIYGSDALAGVVNIILKKDYEGFGLDYQYGEATDGGDVQNRVTLTGGGNFADGRGNAVISGTYQESKGLRSAQRSNTETDDIALCRLTGDINDCQTEQEPFFSSFSEFGRFFVPSTGESFTVSQGTGATGTVVPWSTADFGFNRQAFRRYSVPTERYLLSSMINYEFSDSINAFGEINYAQTKTRSDIEPFPHSNSDLNIGGIPVDNPFVPQAIRDAVLDAEDTEIEYFRRMTEVGTRGSGATRDTFRFVVGLEGDIADRFEWNTYYSFGHMNDDQQGGGQINVLAMREALNVIDGDGDPATFDPVCASEAARAEGCAPINLFGKGSISQDAADWVRAPSSRQQETEQQVFGASIGGDAFELPAGALSFAVGVEWRDEQAEDVPDALTQRGLNAGNAEAPIFGSYDSKEAFIEVEVPILADMPGIHELTVGGAYRYADYSTVGTTDAYTGRLFYAPIESLRFRTQWARAVRAPNITELFAPGGENFEPVSDPCDGVTAADTDNISVNCRSIQAIATRIAATGSFTLTQPEIQGTGGFTSKGNPNLDAETSDSWSVGAVFNDDLGEVGSLTVSLDYFEIEIEDLIDTVDRQSAVDFCFDTDPAGFPNQFCPFLVRDDDGPAFQLGELKEVNSGFVNEGTLTTEGVDLAVSLQSTLSDWFGGAPGSLSIRGNYTYLLDYTEDKFGVEDDRVGETAYAEHEFQTAVTYIAGPWSVQWEWNYIDDSVPDNSNPLFAFDVGDYQTHDFQVSFDVAEAGLMPGFAGEGSRIYIGVNNAFDEDAPEILSGIPGNTTGTDTDADVYDPVGRTFYAGLSFSL